jgi:hypothetical protein
MSPLVKVGLSRFGDVSFDDWSKAQGAFRSLIGDFATKGDEASYSETLQWCRKLLPQLETDRLPFRVNPRIVNILEAQLRAEFDSPAASVSSRLIIQLADEAIKQTSVNHGTMIEAAMRAVWAAREDLEPEEGPDVLRYVLRLACVCSMGIEAFPQLFEKEIKKLLVRGPTQRSAEVDAVVKVNVPIRRSSTGILEIFATWTPTP